MEGSYPLPTDLISLLAFGQPRIPSTNDKQQDRGVCLKHVCCRLILARYGKMGGCVGASGRGVGEGVTGATRGRGQEQHAPHGVMLTQQPPSLCRGTVPPQECVWHAARCWQPWGCVVYSWVPAARLPHAGDIQLPCILQRVLGETRVSPITAVPHRHNHAGRKSQLPDEGAMLGSPSPHAHPGWAAHASEGHLRGPAHRQDAFPVQIVGLKQTKGNSRQNFG